MYIKMCEYLTPKSKITIVFIALCFLCSIGFNVYKSLVIVNLEAKVTQLEANINIKEQEKNVLLQKYQNTTDRWNEDKIKFLERQSNLLEGK